MIVRFDRAVNIYLSLILSWKSNFIGPHLANLYTERSQADEITLHLVLPNPLMTDQMSVFFLNTEFYIFEIQADGGDNM